MKFVIKSAQKKTYLLINQKYYEKTLFYNTLYAWMCMLELLYTAVYEVLTDTHNTHNTVMLKNDTSNLYKT